MGFLEEAEKLAGAVVAVEGVKKVDPNASILTEGAAAVEPACVRRGDGAHRSGRCRVYRRLQHGRDDRTLADDHRPMVQHRRVRRRVVAPLRLIVSLRQVDDHRRFW